MRCGSTHGVVAESVCRVPKPTSAVRVARIAAALTPASAAPSTSRAAEPAGSAAWACGGSGAGGP